MSKMKTVGWQDLTNVILLVYVPVGVLSIVHCVHANEYKLYVCMHIWYILYSPSPILQSTVLQLVFYFLHFVSFVQMVQFEFFVVILLQ